MDDRLVNHVRHLREVEGLSIRQTAEVLGLSRKKTTRIIRQGGVPGRKRSSILKDYERLIQEWYEAYPSLKATQVHDRLLTYGFTGGYTVVKEYTRPYRRKKKRIYHELTFLPGEEGQVDWMERTFPFGAVYGFVFILSYSRYLYCRFYPRHSMEFFLEGHQEAYGEIGGIPRRGRYDNLKSVVIRRRPETVYNGQFLDFAAHYGFSIHLCTPGRANEKGRVERVIADIGRFLAAETFSDLDDLNRKVTRWRKERNGKVHRTTGRAPSDMLEEENLRHLPRIAYKASRVKTAMVTPTGFVHFETNRYSAPSGYSHRACSLTIYPRHIEIVVDNRVIVSHRRSFLKHQTIEHPLHREKALALTPHFKQQRILQLIRGMDEAAALFLKRLEADGADPMEASSVLFKLLRSASKATLLSALRQANSLGTVKVDYIVTLLHPAEAGAKPVYPRDPKLLAITYERRELANYDDLV